jgi:antitoxin (DNA-binding transcriptional repressor) of toxin-antitoxin stability system
MENIQLSQLQENVRAIIAAVKRSDKSVLISDKGKLLVKIVPVSSSGQSWLGCMKDTGKIIGDIVSPAESTEAWEGLSQ